MWWERAVLAAWYIKKCREKISSVWNNKIWMGGGPSADSISPPHHPITASLAEPKREKRWLVFSEEKRQPNYVGQREYSQSLFSRINPNKTLGFLNTWFSSPILLGFLPLPNPIHRQENQVFQVREYFLFGFCLVLEIQASVWFSSNCLCFAIADEMKIFVSERKECSLIFVIYI
jgi:hypothetical protein